MYNNKKGYALKGIAVWAAIAASSIAYADAVGVGANLSIGAKSDGSSKASGTSYGKVRDGKTSTYWAPNGATGRISIKWSSNTTVGGIVIHEASGYEGNIGNWQVVNNNTGAVLQTGTGAGAITFDAVSLKKINFEILSSNGKPTVAEFETYASMSNSGDNGDDGGNDDDDDDDNPGDGNDDTDDGNNTDDDKSGGGSDHLGGDCETLINDDNVNWRESDLKTDQEIVACLAASLGKPVGFGEGTTGGYDAGGNSKLVIITNNKPEDQILAAISSAQHNWIVFDKDDFKNETQIMMYRPYCANDELQSALGLNEAQCRDPYAWCSKNGVSSGNCLEKFFNDELDDKGLPVRNYMIDSNTTIDGRGAKATFLFNGFKIGSDSSGSATHTSENVIITNNRFVGVGHTEDHGLDPDMVRSTGESHKIWIHQNTFENTGDSAYDVKVGAYGITVSFNKLLNVKRASLHGSSDSRTINAQITTTVHNNLFVTEDQYYGDNKFDTLRRVPLMRRGQSHMFNNVFYNYRKDLLSVRKGGRILFEDNVLMNNASQAANKGDDMEYFVDKLLRDFREGGLKVEDSYVWMANSNCQLQGSASSLAKSEGSTPDMMSQYNSDSRSRINNNRISVGQDLADYLFATAGKDGKTPWVASGDDSISSVIASAPGTCQ